MIDYINLRLVFWAEWAQRRDSGALGFPRQSAYTRAVLFHHRGVSLEEIHEAAMETERAVLAMRKALPGLYAAVWEFYRRGGSVECKARALGVHRDTLYARVHQSHCWIMNWFQDQHVPSQVDTMKKYLRAVA